MVRVLIACLVLAVGTRPETALSGGQPVVVAVETGESALDGSWRQGCKDQVEIAAGDTHELWIAFGGVRPAAKNGWDAVAVRTHCGRGSFDTASAHFGRMLGVPYLIVELATVPAESGGRDVRLEASLRMRKLSGFDQRNRPIYVRSTDTRTLQVPARDDAVLPLLISDSREREAFQIHELFLRLRATVPGSEPPLAYGAISVSADVPAAAILLDGGATGRISEQSPTLLRNVLAGEREVRVTDMSGRTAAHHVVVEQDRTVTVALALLNSSASATGSDLKPLGKNAQAYEEYWRVKDGAVVVSVPAGEFLMGSPEGAGEAVERPQHRVYVSGFLIDKTEVTWRQFRKYTEATGVALPPVPVWGTPEHFAASNLLWAEAKTYCEWAGGRLPTEAEWEKAARGTTGEQYPWGNEWDPDRCNSFDGGPHRPENVGSYPDCVSPYGVLDMSGSALEWCADWFGEAYYTESAASDPKGPPSGSRHVLRGGSWLNQATWLRSAYRYKGDLTSRNVHNGFRCVQVPPGS